MEHFKNFNSWFFESKLWKEELFNNSGEKEVADIAEETLLTKDLILISQDEDSFKKLTQIISTQDGEKVLEIKEHLLTLYFTPIEFLRWDRIGADGKPIETQYIVKKVEENKI